MCAETKPKNGTSEGSSKCNWQEIAEQMIAECDPEKMLRLANELNLLLLEREHHDTQSTIRNARTSREQQSRQSETSE